MPTCTASTICRRWSTSACPSWWRTGSRSSSGATWPRRPCPRTSSRCASSGVTARTTGGCSPDRLAFPVRHTDRLIAAAIDAKRNEVFCALYRPVPGGLQREEPYRVCSADDLASELMAMNEDVLVVGDGGIRYAANFDDARHVELATVGFAYPSASALVELAHPRAVREEFVPPWELEPLYLRKSDAELSWADRRRPA